MAEYFCSSSTLISVPKKQLAEAEAILSRIRKELKDSNDEYLDAEDEVDEDGVDLEDFENEYVGFEAKVDENGVWIHGDEIVPENVEKLVKALVEELKLPGIHVCSWSYTCSKHRLDEFGGGAFAVQYGCKTVWVYAAEEAQRKAERLAKKSPQNDREDRLMLVSALL